MKMRYYWLILFVSAFFLSPLGIAGDFSVWQGQYFTGTTFNVGTFDFNFTVYDAQVGGGVLFQHNYFNNW